jgi:hypothetical protein
VAFKAGRGVVRGLCIKRGSKKANYFIAKVIGKGVLFWLFIRGHELVYCASKFVHNCALYLSLSFNGI